MDLGITGRTALVTGGDSGIGWTTAKLLIAEGATVVISDQDQATLDEAAARLDAPEGRVHAFAADVTRTDQLAELHRRVAESVGEIDILVQCAGVTGAQGLFHEIDDEGWTSTLEVDLLGPVRLVREFLPDLRSGGWGRLVLTASEDAVQPYDDELPYCAAKAGVLAFAKGLSRSYAQEGLLVNTVSPAFIRTPMTDAMMSRRADQRGTSLDEAIASFLDEERPYLELKRRGEAEEVAAVIAFLCSDRASFVNGSNYRVDSGSVATI
ncbi:SDR family NAD(P)-dependent oxidoreductase [Rathayibacter tritici]|uniref:Ketoacyl reductase n=1 Tax=Rathayibacter tritici TaxID=33888 RepID=A0A160KUC1_9MICO|nr:SDR family oxidoreductase [Rathayibacter tritici]AND17476.1 ketoacyl reductase [Rathayibacter tritici]PPF30772.1 SDR family NAD(P)-dependent oxidoreductase [Rathayibacter tritici]PPF68171.1 SDR family NAD(P)-dependent oxidoreductase [Rathayibacter tritici]PPG07945.1 SDR family NAD(P)-dependent oxidoreductase [Rathayibacter tritici]PPI20091.1 SDR family NAD(P)-dependent oxidoreductase [Rathayibacter tritici]